MAGQNPGTNTDQFDAYFQRADLDRDGRISGAEAVAFFQGSNLPKNVLAQIWMHADQARTGFLDRAQFYNALKLVTVAQSKRDLTPDIVKAALYGPAAAKIPAPQIHLPATPVPQSSSMASATPQMGVIPPTSSQSLGFRGQVPNASANQQYLPHQQNQQIRPPQAMPAFTAPHPPQGSAGSEVTRAGSLSGPGLPSTNISNDWLGGRNGGGPVGLTSPNRGVSPSTSSASSQPQNLVSPSALSAAKDSRAPVVSGNGFSSDPFFGGDVFSATSSFAAKQGSPALTSSASSTPTSSATVPASIGLQTSARPGSLDSLQGAFTMNPGSQFQHSQPQANTNQPVSAQSSSSLASSGILVGLGKSTSIQTQPPWPRMAPSDVQKYSKVFVEVDTDRDGRITGEQARNLFLSWRLPREVLKQVWDLSDQDNDSMLSLREFCIALYLMERYREGRSLPAVLPNNILFDETVPPRTSQPQSSYGNVNWGATSGLRQQLGVAGAQSVAPFTPPGQVTTSKADGAMQGYQQNAKVPVLENPLMNRLSNGERNSQKSKFEEVEDSGKKVEGTQNMILDSKEKIEFYRTKMQELVLYKSRCDNRLNEITERAFVDKREAELLGKKYEEKYKQVAEIASKLAVEEAKFRDVQERKVELHQAILKMENGGSADGILQVRADRIQSDLEGLMKGLSECCKKHGVDVKSTTMIELPIGWQPGIQEGAADWDEDWDKFEDEGFSFVKDLSLDAHNGIYSPEQKSSSVWTDKASPNGSLTPDSLSNAEDKFEKPSSAVEHVLEHESTYTQSEDDLAGSPPRSPPGKAAPGSLFQEFAESHSGKSTELDAEIHQSFDEPSWGAFDTNDDTDSVWGFNPVNTRVSDLEKPRENYFFGSGDSSVNPIRTESPSTDSMFQKKSPFTFVDSLPGTPVSKSGNSPPRYSGGSGDHFFDNFSRFDSFSTHDGGFSTVPDSLTRFDSINSSRDFGRRETLTRFDSVNSTRDFGHIPGFSSFDDTDPFGSTGPFKVSSESQTPKKSSDNWSSF